MNTYYQPWIESPDQHYASQVAISYEMAQNEDYTAMAIAHMRRDGAIKIFDEIYRHNGPVVVETHLESWDDPQWMARKYVLHYRLTAVSSRNVVIPSFEFVNHAGVREWKCAACGMINIIDASFCGERHKTAAGCGRPRDFARQ